MAELPATELTGLAPRSSRSGTGGSRAMSSDEGRGPVAFELTAEIEIDARPRWSGGR